MSEEISSKPPTSFYVIGVAALLWNLLGISAYVQQATLSPEALAEMSELQRTFFETRPAWATSAFAIAVNGGALGCVLLLMRKYLAYYLFVLSLAGVAVQSLHSWFLSNGIEAFGTAGVVLALPVWVVGIYLIWYAKDAQKKRWIS